MIKRLLLLLLLSAGLMLGAVGCGDTAEGFGEDVEDVGEDIQDASSALPVPMPPAQAA